MKKLGLALLLLLQSVAVFGHGGGVDANGCHRERRTNSRHCHGQPDNPPAPSPTRARAATPQPLLSVPEAEPDALTKVAQKLLNKLGYDAGRADGRIGEKTRNAIMQFQRDRGLPITGAVTERLVDALIDSLAG